MAKLSAHGQELLRVYWEKTHAADTDRLISWEKQSRAYMSDGKILEKRDVRFKDGGFHSYGWHLAAKLKPGKDPYEYAGIIRERVLAGNTGWTIVTDLRREEKNSRNREHYAAMRSMGLKKTAYGWE